MKPDLNDTLRNGGEEAVRERMSKAKPFIAKDKEARQKRGSESSSKSKPDTKAPLLPVRPFKWVDWANLPTRKWLYPRTYIRKFLSATISPSGVGKSGILTSEALAMVTGKDLLRDGFHGEPLRVWYWSGEDPADELQRQFQAAMLHFDLTPEDVGERLILDSGRDLRITLAKMMKGEAILDEDMMRQVKATIQYHRIDVALFDPLVTLHRLPENLNDNMDLIAGALADVANATNCAAGIAVHTRKPASGISGPITSDDARGGGAIVARTRVARVLNRMTKEEASKAGIEGKNAHRSYFRIGIDKTSLTAPDEDDTWRFLRGVRIPNGPNGDLDGDIVRVVTRWNYPDAMATVTAAHADAIRDRIGTPPAKDDHWRDNPQAKHWAGYLVAEVVGFDVKATDGKDASAAKARAGTILGKWVAAGLLRRVELMCADRKEHPCIIRGDL